MTLPSTCTNHTHKRLAFSTYYNYLVGFAGRNLRTALDRKVNSRRKSQVTVSKINTRTSTQMTLPSTSHKLHTHKRSLYVLHVHVSSRANLSFTEREVNTHTPCVLTFLYNDGGLVFDVRGSGSPRLSWKMNSRSKTRWTL